MIRIALCDDELPMLEEYGTLLEKYRIKCDEEIVYVSFHSPLELLAEIETGNGFDVLFLDVMMPGENGIDTAKEIRKHDTNVRIIFVTSSAEYAVQSYTVGAYYYYIKPLLEESFFELMDAVTSACKKTQVKNLIMRCKSGVERIDLDRLAYCEVIARTLIFHMDGGKTLESSGSMDKLYDKLAQYENFLRPHRSFLINMDYIQNISRKEVMLTNQAAIPIPHGKYSEIRNLYLEYAFHREQVFVS